MQDRIWGLSIHMRSIGQVTPHRPSNHQNSFRGKRGNIVVLRQLFGCPPTRTVTPSSRALRFRSTQQIRHHSMSPLSLAAMYPGQNNISPTVHYPCLSSDQRTKHITCCHDACPGSARKPRALTLTAAIYDIQDFQYRRCIIYYPFRMRCQ